MDDITIREQLVLSWPGDLNTSSFYNPPRNPKFALCPGLVIHPSGRFVKRSFPEGLVSTDLCNQTTIIFSVKQN